MPLVRASTHASHVYEEKYTKAFSPKESEELWAVPRFWKKCTLERRCRCDLSDHAGTAALFTSFLLHK